MYSVTISNGPVTMDNDGQKTNGFHFSVFEEWESDWVDDETGEVFLNKKSDYEGWVIYPNGKFKYEVYSDSDSICLKQDGTFDSSKYEEFVNQMKEDKRDWMNDLSYDENTAVYS